MLLRPIQLALFDAQSLFRESIYLFLSRQRNINVVIQAKNPSDLFNKLDSTQADIILMDFLMPGIQGGEVVETILMKYPSVKIIGLSNTTNVDVISSLLDYGIHGFVSKFDEPDELLSTIEAVFEDRACKTNLFIEALYHNRQKVLRSDSNRSQVLLSDREKMILQLVWEEKSNKEIASELFLGVRTVERMRLELKEKIGVKSTVGLIRYAVEKNILKNFPDSADNTKYLRSNRH